MTESYIFEYSPFYAICSGVDGRGGDGIIIITCF